MRVAIALLLAGGTAVAQPVMQPDYDGPPSLCPPPPAPPAAAPPPLAEAKQQWLVLGAVTDQHGTLVGGRVELDAIVHGAWSLGLAGTYRDGGTDATARSNATVYLAGTAALGPLLVRARVGAGVAFVDGGSTVNSSAMSIGGTTTSPIGEAALTAALPLGGDWLVLGGPVIDAAQAAPTEISLLAGSVGGSDVANRFTGWRIASRRVPISRAHRASSSSAADSPSRGARGAWWAHLSGAPMIVRTKIGGKPHYWVSRYHAFHILGLDNVRMHRTYAGAVPLERGGVYFLGY